MKMRLSHFGYAKDIAAIEKAGFDCIEMHYSEIIPMTDEEFGDLKRELTDSPLTVEVIDNPLPLDTRIISPDFSIEKYREHLEIGASRAAELGARFCNFGNGKARSLPIGVTPAETNAAKGKICALIKELCEINAKHNITVLMEPLSPIVSNFIFNVPEAVAFANELGVNNLKTFIDLRWFVNEKRPYEEIIAYADHILHIHIDNPLTPFPERPIPRITDDFDYTPFIEALKKICYKGIISCEANAFDDFDNNLSEVIGFFRHFGIRPYRS